MNMDGFLLKALTVDLNRTLADQRIDKIHQPDSNHLTIHVGKRRLTISVAPQNIYLTLDGPRLANPPSPPFFCLMLRKYLTNSRLTEVRMPDFERIVEFTGVGRDELGEAATYTLMAELTGRHSNVLLVNSDGVIIDAMRRVPLGDGVRPVFPGLRYERPPGQSKIAPFRVSAAALYQLGQAATPGMGLAEFIAAQVQGMSLLLAREIAHRLGRGTALSAMSEEAWGEIASLIHSLAGIAESAALTSFYQNGTAPDLEPHIIPLHHLGPHAPASGVSEAVSTALRYQEEIRQELQVRRKLQQILSAHLKKVRRLTSALQEDLAATATKDRYKRHGELLYANLGSYDLQGNVALVTDYYDESLARVAVPVDPSRSLADNARHFFRQYEKAVGKERHSLARLADAELLLAYLEGLQSSVAQADDTETLREIEQEMDAQGLTQSRKQHRAPRTVGRTPDAAEARPRRFVSPDGVAVLVGRNNLQNDRLVKSARAEDLWFHVQKAPGSHCIVEALSPVPESTIEFAASLAAYYSSMRDSTLVPVDYTERKHVRRPAGAKPGYVIYERQQTVVVNMAKVRLPEQE